MVGRPRVEALQPGARKSPPPEGLPLSKNMWASEWAATALVGRNPRERSASQRASSRCSVS